MTNSIYLGMSAQIALQRRLDTIANNMANASTVGFRTEQIRFATAPSDRTGTDLSFGAIGAVYLERRPGEIVKTDNPLDIAIDGDAWLAISTAQGTAYSRDGRLQIGPTGELMTLTGHPVLDVGEAPIRLDPAAGPPTIARDGAINQGNRTVGTIGLFTIDADARFDRSADASVIPSKPAKPATDNPLVGMRQGFIERSNVNPMVEMSRLVLDQRMFEAVTSAVSEIEQQRSDAIRTLGSPS